MKRLSRVATNTRALLPFRVRAVAALLCSVIGVGLLVAPSASANYEQVGTFASAGEGALGQTPTGVAVNISGAGGVPAGTIYAVSSYGLRVTRYSATGEFREAWGWGVADYTEAEFQRCGPDGEAAHPTCSSFGGVGGEGTGQLGSPIGISVDQATGYVYVVNQTRNDGVVQVFSPDGSRLIAAFGTRGSSETFAEEPGKIHREPSSQSIAVDRSGNVYISDWNDDGSESRIMVFEPQTPGDYEHYVYAGRAKDIASSQNPRNVAVDASGNVYAVGGASPSSIYEFRPSAPGQVACEYRVPGGGVVGFAVDEETGAPLYFSQKNRKLHGLSACDAEGAFQPGEEFAPERRTEEIEALALNPTLAYEGVRPLGVLYALDGLETAEESQLGEIFAPAEVRYPAIESESVSGVGVTSATLGAGINPKGSLVRYTFQYVSNATYEANAPEERFAGATEVPVGGAALGSGQEALRAGATAGGLSPATEYRYRVIATSRCNPSEEEEVCQAVGEAQVFRTFPITAQGLPDDRAYELVSPAQKNGGEVFPVSAYQASCGNQGCKPGISESHTAMQSSESGDAVVYEGLPFSPTGGASNGNGYISRRTSSGWQTTNLSPPLLTKGSGFREFNSDLTMGVLDQGLPALSLGAPAETSNLYIQNFGDPSLLSPLITAEPPNRSSELALEYAGASADFSHIIFAADAALTGETPFAPPAADPGVGQDNLYEWYEGAVRLVNVLPGNAETAPGASLGSPSGLEHSTFHAISASGSRIFWSGESGQVYVREAGQRTIAIPDPGEFVTASDDGSQVLLSDGHLYDLEAESMVDLTGGQDGFEGIAGQSESLSSIYFVDTAPLTNSGEVNAIGEHAEAGSYNLYHYESGAVSFIATLLPADGPEGLRPMWGGSPTDRSAEASPGGRWLSFLSTKPITDSDNSGSQCYRNSVNELVPGACLEVFLYDSATGRLACASCNPSGTAPLGSSYLPVPEGKEIPQLRYMMNNGRLYFDSTDNLSPLDTNGRVEDVYQYEPAGIGSCSDGGGCVSLISGGREPVDSNFLAASATGANVFFTTRDQLVRSDHDELVDLYDAREGGGFASEAEGAPSECQGEACQAATNVPSYPSPASASYPGASHPDRSAKKGRRCPSGTRRVRRKGSSHCTAHRHRRKRSAHKHAHKGHQPKGKGHAKRSTGRGRGGTK